MASRPNVVVAVSGASGAILSNATIHALLALDIGLEIVCSDYGELMWSQETDERFRDAVSRWQKHGQITVHRPDNVAAPIASGSFPAAWPLSVRLHPGPDITSCTEQPTSRLRKSGDW